MLWRTIGVDGHQLMHREFNRNKSSVFIDSCEVACCGHKIYGSIRSYACHCLIKPMNMQQQRSPLLFHCASLSLVGLFFFGLAKQKIWALEPRQWGCLFSCYGACSDRLTTAVCYMSYSCTLFTGYHRVPEIFVTAVVRDIIQIINFVLRQSRGEIKLLCVSLHAYARNAMEN